MEQHILKLDDLEAYFTSPVLAILEFSDFENFVISKHLINQRLPEEFANDQQLELRRTTTKKDRKS